MKTVVNIIHGEAGTVTSEIQQVPDDYIQCTASGAWVPRSEMCDTEGTMIRTNSLWTYNMPGGMAHIKIATADHVKSQSYKTLVNKVLAARDALENSIPIQELIDGLLELQRVKPNARVCVTQEGYYAHGRYGSVYTDPEFVCDDVYTIGHSTQNYG